MNMWYDKIMKLKEAEEFEKRRHFDFILGSVHFAKDIDPYEERYWEGRSVQEGYRVYLEETLECVKIHDHYDVLGHLTYASKSPYNPPRS